MIYFKSDYTQGSHPQILKALVETNSEHTGTHTLDVYSDRAAELIKEIIGRPDAEVHMMVGGTPTNVCTIAAALRPYEAVVAPRSAQDVYKRQIKTSSYRCSNRFLHEIHILTTCLSRRFSYGSFFNLCHSAWNTDHYFGSEESAS